MVRSGFATKRAAEAAFRDLSKEVIEGEFGKPPPPPVPTLAEFVTRYLKEGTAGNKAKSVSVEAHSLERFMRYVPPDMPLNEITPELIDVFIARRLSDKPARSPKGSGVKESTVLREFSSVRRMFSVAMRWGIVASNPAAGAKKPRVPEGDVVFLELPEQAALLEACREIDEQTRLRTGLDRTSNSRLDTPYLRPLVAVALYAGLRASEILHLKWEDIDFEHSRVTVRNREGHTTKSKKIRVLELHPSLANELIAWKDWFSLEIDRASSRANDPSLHAQLRAKARNRVETLKRCSPAQTGFIFPSFRKMDPSGRTPQPMDNIRKSLARAVKESGIRKRVTLHVLRHSFAVTLARQNVPLTKISKALGHTNLKTTQIYLRFMPDEGADVTSRIPDLVMLSKSQKSR